MQLILAVLLSVLATAKMCFQSAISKKNVKNSADALYFNILAFAVISIVFLPWMFNCSGAVWIYAAMAAIFTIGYQMFYTKALSVGNVSLTVLAVNFSMVINVIASYIFFDEKISAVRLVAIIMMIISFVVCNGTTEVKISEKKRLVYAGVAMLTNSCASVVQKFFGESSYSDENRAFISCIYLMAALMSSVIYSIAKKNSQKTFKLNFDVIKYAVAVGVSLALYQLFFTYGLVHIDGTFLFPAQTGGTMLLSTLSGIVIFKDKFTRKQIVGIILGFIALILMNY